VPYYRGASAKYCTIACYNSKPRAATVPKGTKFSNEHKAALSASFQRSLTHKSKNQRGDKNPGYKGGRIDKNGYHVLFIDGKQVAKHRQVMEKMIGRKLTDEETVHHKNGQRSDNRESNLELWSSGNPKGQRIEDKVQWAMELLRDYGAIPSSHLFTAHDVAAGLALG
jgi:hypothetical protein